eukprot:UN3944
MMWGRAVLIEDICTPLILQCQETMGRCLPCCAQRCVATKHETIFHFHFMHVDDQLHSHVKMNCHPCASETYMRKRSPLRCQLIANHHQIPHMNVTLDYISWPYNHDPLGNIVELM